MTRMLWWANEAICVEVIQSSLNESLVLSNEDNADEQDTTITNPASCSEVSATLITLWTFLGETLSDTTKFYEIEDQVTHLVFQHIVQFTQTSFPHELTCIFCCLTLHALATCIFKWVQKFSFDELQLFKMDNCINWITAYYYYSQEYAFKQIPLYDKKFAV